MTLSCLCHAGYQRMADFKNAIHKLIGLHVGPTNQAAAGSGCGYCRGSPVVLLTAP